MLHTFSRLQSSNPYPEVRVTLQITVQYQSTLSLVVTVQLVSHQCPSGVISVHRCVCDLGTCILLRGACCPQRVHDLRVTTPGCKLQCSATILTLNIECSTSQNEGVGDVDVSFARCKYQCSATILSIHCSNNQNRGVHNIDVS